MVISPYWDQDYGTWVVDDEAVGLVKEPFVLGVPEIIDDLVKDIPNARNGFRLIFATQPFPKYQREFVWQREDSGGNWYKVSGQPMEGWLCPALFKYFNTAPDKIYVKAECIGGKFNNEPIDEAALKDKIEKLERLVGKLTLENELLKKGRQPPLS